MFSRRYHLFTLLGFRVWVDATWLLLAALIVWSLAAQVFPFQFRGLGWPVYLAMGLVGAAGFFLSIVLHELSHSLVARRFGIPMRGITLFIFGGVAEMHDEPRSPAAEFLMAVVGPLTSLVLGAALLLVSALAPGSPWLGIAGYLGVINLLLAVFNLLPAFPLDGGRLLRSALWRLRGDFRWATRISASIGQGFGVLLMAAGAVWFVFGHLVTGVWWFVLGLFLQNAAQSAYRQVLVRRALEGETVRRFLQPDPVAVPRATTIDRLVDDFVYRYGHKTFPVTEGERLVGCVGTRQIKDLPRGEWISTTVGAVMVPCSDDNAVSPDLDVMQALELMNRTQEQRLMVVEGDRLVGAVTAQDLLRFFSLKMDLEPEGVAAAAGLEADERRRSGPWPGRGSWQPR